MVRSSGWDYTLIVFRSKGKSGEGVMCLFVMMNLNVHFLLSRDLEKAYS